MGTPGGAAAPLFRKEHYLAALAAALVTFAVYSPSLRSGFVIWDDDLNFQSAQPGERGAAALLRRAFLPDPSQGPYAPVARLSAELDRALWNGEPAGYHLTAAALHSANAALFCLFCCALLAFPFRRASGAELGAAGAVSALLFSLHPLRVESVAWLSDRHDLLALFFLLSSGIAYLRLRPGAATRPGRGMPAVTALFLAALLSKGIAVTFPVVLLLLDIYPLRRLSWDPRRWFSAPARSVLLEKAPLFLLAAAFALAGYLLQRKVGNITSYAEGPDRAAAVLYSLSFYLQKTLWPSGLLPYYRFPEGYSILSAHAAAAAAAVGGFTAAAVLGARRFPGAAAAWFYYLVTLFPVSGVVRFTFAAADRYSYISCLGFAALGGWAFLRAAEARRGRAAAAAAGVLLALLGAASVKQQGYWRDSGTLWRRVIALDPGAQVAHNNLGVFLASSGKAAEAVESYKAAAAADPGFYRAHMNLCGLLPGLGKAAEALPHCAAAVRLRPGAAGVHNNAGMALAAAGRLKEAIEEYGRELAGNPGSARTHYNLAHTLSLTGDLRGAEAAYARALVLEPGMGLAHYNLGVLYAATGRPGRAERSYRAAIAAGVRLPALHNNLAILLSRRGRLREALEQYRQALRLAPDYAEAHYNMGLDLAAAGRRREADAHYRAAVKLNPAIGPSYLP